MPRTKQARRSARKPLPAVPFEGRIEALGAQGDGIASGPDGPVYAPITIPGDQVRAERRGNRLDAIEIIAPGPDRVNPPCTAFGTCGGCALQHMRDTAVADWKRDMVATALAHRGLAGAPVRDTVTLPFATRRRVTLSVMRTKAGPILGFMGRKSHDVIAATPCLIMTPKLKAIWDPLTVFAHAVTAVIKTAQIHVLLSETGLDIDLRAEVDMDDLTTRQDLIAAGQALDAARLSVTGEILAEWRAPTVSMGTVPVVPSPGGFLQPSREGQAALTTLIDEALEGIAGPVVDLFAGCGTFTFPRATHQPVHAVEGEAAAVEALTRAAHRAAGLKAVTAERRDLFRRPLSAKELKGFEAAIIDPPRAGAEAQAQELAQTVKGSNLRRIAAVSCNPASFARDARILVDGGYRLDWVVPVDQFAWSPHIECVGMFAREE